VFGIQVYYASYLLHGQARWRVTVIALQEVSKRVTLNQIVWLYVCDVHTCVQTHENIDFIYLVFKPTLSQDALTGRLAK